MGRHEGKDRSMPLWGFEPHIEVFRAHYLAC